MAKKTKQQILKEKQEILSLHVFDIDLYPAWKPTHFEEALGIYNMLGVRPVAYQMGHRFYWKQKHAWFYVKTPELLAAVKPLVGKAVLWMPSIEEMIVHANANGITVSIQHSRQVIRQYYTVLIYDTLYPEMGNVELMRYSSMDMWFCFAHALARAFRRRMEFVGLETIKPVIYLDDPEYHRITMLMVDQAKKEREKRKLRRQQEAEAG